MTPRNSNSDELKIAKLPQESDLIPFDEKTLIDEEEYVRFLFSGFNFTRLATKHTVLEMSLFRKCVLQESILNKLRIYDCVFAKSDLSNALWNAAALQRVELDECKIIGLQLNEAIIQDLRVHGCIGQYSQWRFSDMKKVTFIDTDFTEADFQGSTIVNSSFTNCKLDRTDFTDAKLSNMDIRGSSIENIRIKFDQLTGIIIDPAQAIYLMTLLGVTIR
jgi:uncharacterized protein YjbI with pentapeptide repeats